jgi:hypothetical protein
MKRDIRACSRSELDAINAEIAKYKSNRAGAKQSDVSTQKASNSEILNESLYTEDAADLVNKRAGQSVALNSGPPKKRDSKVTNVTLNAGKTTINAEQLDLL